MTLKRGASLFAANPGICDCTTIANCQPEEVLYRKTKVEDKYNYPILFRK